ncbi:MAG: hypothetical protein AB9834_01710 [Lentimicrobium sp.]
MKTGHLEILLLLFLICAIPVFSSGQQSAGKLDLIYDTWVSSTTRIIAGEGKENTENIGTLTIKLKYIIDKQYGDMIQMTLSPVWISGKDNCLWVFNRKGTVESVIQNFSGSDMPERKGYFTNQKSEIEPFYWVNDYSDLISLQPVFDKTGALPISNEFKGLFSFKINSKKYPKAEKFDLTLNLYFGKRKSWSKKILPVRIAINLPVDLNCKEFIATFNSIYKQEYDYNSLSKKVSEARIGEIQNLNSRIDKAISAIDKLPDLKNKIDADPRNRKCEELKILSDSISKILQTNEKSKFELLKNSLSDLEKAKKTDSIKQPQPITKAQTAEQIGEKLKETEQNRLNEKKDNKNTQEVPCEEFLKKTGILIQEVSKRFKAEEFNKTNSELKAQLGSIEILVNGINTGSGPEKDKLKDDVLQVSFKNRKTGSELDKYDEDFARLKSKLNNRKDCQIISFSTEIDNLIMAVDTLKEEWSEINSFITRVLYNIDLNSKDIVEAIKTAFSPAFFSILKEYINLNTSLSMLSERYLRKINSGKYYKWERDKLLNLVTEYDRKSNSINQKLDSVNRAADSVFNIQLGGLSAIWSDTTEENIAAIKQVKNDIGNRIIGLKSDVEASVPDRFPWALLIIGIFIVLTLLFGARVYYLAMVRRKKSASGITAETNGMISKNRSASPLPDIVGQDSLSEPEKVPEPQKVGGITITRTVPQGSTGNKVVVAGKGLSHVYGKIGSEFYKIDLREIWADTLVRNVYIHRNCIKKTYKFFFESCAVEGKIPETGGYLIGSWDFDNKNSGKYNVSLEDFIEPGDDAVYEEYQLNFGAKIGVRLERVIQDYREKAGKEYTLTAWFHSHPEIKIFLSNHDLDVQERLSSQEHKHKLLALVIDPNTQEDNKMAFLTGIFSYKSNGAMNNNPGEMKLVKWKDLYEWAITPVVPEIRDHYCIEFNKVFNKSAITRLYLNDRCITRFSLFLDELQINPMATGCFTGEITNNGSFAERSVIFTDFTENPDENHAEIVGRFFGGEDPDTKITEFISSKADEEKTEILVFCDNLNKELIMLTRKDNSSFNLRSDVRKTIRFSEIETWPTRRR